MSAYVDDHTAQRRAALNGRLWNLAYQLRGSRDELEVIAALQRRVTYALTSHVAGDGDVEDYVLGVVVHGLAYLDDCARRRDEEARRS